MYLIDTAGRVLAKPAKLIAEATAGWFNNAPGAGPGTKVAADWMNMIQAELKAVIEGAGLVLDRNNDAQLLAAMQALAAGVLPTGARSSFTGATCPAGWVRGNGLTIGNPASNATERSNADCLALFTLHWADRPDLQLYTSAGAPIARGANAAADWAANRALALPDYRGRVGIGKDDMGNAAANRVTNALSGITGTTLGAAGGTEAHQLTVAELPAHDHAPNDGQSGPPVSTTGAFGNGSQTGNTSGLYNVQRTGSTGGGGKHQNMQPSIVELVLIKL
jgi:microcystin-dependent protein